MNKAQLKELSKIKFTTSVDVTCSICSKVVSINASNPSIYTDEVRKKFTCLICDIKKKKKMLP